MNKLTTLLTQLISVKEKALFIDENNIITTTAFINDIKKLHIYINNTNHPRWAIISHDVYEIAISLFALLSSGREPILLPNTQSGTIARLSTNYDAILSEPLAICHTINAHQTEDVLLGDIDKDQKITFFTSGSTGEPKRVSRAIAHMMQELQTLETVFGASMGNSPVFSSVYACHIYGLLFHLLWPLCKGRSIYRTILTRLTDLNQLTQSAEHINLVSSPALLKRMTDDIKPKITMTVFSSGGMLRQAEANDVYQRMGTYPIEVFGSTETSAIGFRSQHSNADWTPLPGVSIALVQNCLHVCSPFFETKNGITMGDQAHIHDDGSFELLGRVDRIVKIEENRVSLSDIENRLSQHPYVNHAIALAIEKNRQSIAVVVHLTHEGRNNLTKMGKIALNNLFKATLAPNYPCSLLPKQFRYVETMPVNQQGKYVLSDLQQLFGG